MSFGSDTFSTDPNYEKKITNREGDGVNRSVAPQNLGGGNPAPYYEVSVYDKPSQGSSGQIVHTGPGEGVAEGSGGDSTDVQGFFSPTGNKIVIDNSFGSDTVMIQHHSGATIMIDADGAIHMVSTGKKGIGVISPRGDTTVYAKSHLILKADGKITIETAGDLDFNVGGSLGFHVKGDIISNAGGSSEEIVGGSKIVEVVKDMSTMIAGHSRTTAAGFIKLQSSNEIDLDAAGDINIRTDSNFELDAQGTITNICKAAMKLSTKDKFTALATGAITFETKDAFTSKSTGITKLSAIGAASIHSSATVDVLGSGKIQIKGSATDVQVGGSASPDSPGDAAEAPLAQYPTANTIIDTVSTLRVAPDFPVNAKYMSKEEFSLYKNEGGNPNPKAEASAAPNSGAGMVTTAKDTGQTAEPVAVGDYDRPTGFTEGNGTAEKNPLPVPTSVYNSNEKISRHITMGMVLNIRKCPASRQPQVIKEAMNVAWNILDPLFEKFAGKIYISSWYRDAPGPNHVKGGAVDVRCTTKENYNVTAEIAAYARDNLPYSRVFLEKNDEGGIHCHLESAQPGQKGGGLVMTCADPHCHSSTPGLKLSYAVAALKGYG